MQLIVIFADLSWGPIVFVTIVISPESTVEPPITIAIWTIVLQDEFLLFLTIYAVMIPI